MTEMDQLHLNLPSSLLQNENISTELFKFKNDILGLISESETRLTNKINNYYSDNLSSKTTNESSMTSISTKYDQMSQSLASMSVKVDRLGSFEAFSRKANDQIITQEIRLNNLSKDLTKACYKYDKIYMDNLILPGYIGDCCKYKTLKDFFDDVITQLSQLNSLKEKQSIDIKGYKDRLDAVILNFNSQVSGVSKTSLKYTNDSIKDCESKMKEMLSGFNSQINEVSLDNSKHIVEIKRQCKELTEEWKLITDMKAEIYARSASDVECVKTMNQKTKSYLETCMAEFNSIKGKFSELATFIKDVNFRKNLKVDIKKKEINCIARKLNSKRSESLEVLTDKGFETTKGTVTMILTQKEKEKERGLKQCLSHDVESRLKKYINGETDIEHINQSSIKKMQNEEDTDHERDLVNISAESNDKIIKELGAELEQSNCKILRESIDKEIYMTRKDIMNNESPIPTQSYSGKHINTTIQQLNNNSINGDNNININSNNIANNANTNNNCKHNAKRRYSLGSIQPMVNQNEPKKEHKDIDSKISNTEKMVYDLQSYTHQKIKELSNQIALLLNLNGFSLKVNGLIQSLGGGSNKSTTANCLLKSKSLKYEIHKDQDMSLSFSNKVVPVSVIDLVKRNNFPIPNIQHLSSTLGNTSLVVKPRVKARIKTGRDPIDKVLMQTFGLNNNNNNLNNNNEDSNNSSVVRDSQMITPYSKDLNIKTGSSSFNNLADFRTNTKKGNHIHTYNPIDKKQLLYCDSKFTPGRYISLQKLLTNTPNTSSNPELNIC